MNQLSLSRPLSQDCINWKSRYLNTLARFSRSGDPNPADRAWGDQYVNTPLVREELDRIYLTLPQHARPKRVLSYDPWYRRVVMGQSASFITGK